MTYSVYQHWDPLKVCVIGRSYPPEFYSWIKKPRVRSLFEKIAIETEEDYQGIIRKLEEFGVSVMRPNLPNQQFVNGQYVQPPMTPRDWTVMIGETFYCTYGYTGQSLADFYNDVKDPSWPECKSHLDWERLPERIKEECINVHKMHENVGIFKTSDYGCYDHILDHIRQQNNNVKQIAYRHLNGVNLLKRSINGSMVTRVGRDLYFGTGHYHQDQQELQDVIDNEFPNYRNHIVNTGGHSDGTFCPVCPGLIISLKDVPNYKDGFPGWEVVYLPGQSWAAVKPFLKLKEKNHGRWWIPGVEDDQDVVDTVEQWLGHWTGYVEETVFDVNMLLVDPKNVLVGNYNKQVFDALDRYGITPHIVPFRHRYFWDGGIHCIASDLDREGSMQDYFS